MQHEHEHEVAWRLTIVHVCEWTVSPAINWEPVCGPSLALFLEEVETCLDFVTAFYSENTRKDLLSSKH